MQATHRLGKFAPLLLLAALTVLLTACPGISGGGGGNGGAPQISSFTPSQNNVASGTPVTLNWVITGVPTSLSISGSDGTSLSSLIGTNTTVTPTTTTTYTLTATNSSGNDTETTTVTVGGTVTPPTDGSRTVSFGVSSTQDGTFTSDADGGITAGDPRIVNVSAGSTFYAQVTYSGPAPVTGVTIYLANSNPPGFKSDLAQNTNVNGFTLGEAVGGCATDGTQTSITCTYPIKVASGTPNITGLTGAGSEFAYVLRTRIADTTGGEPYDQPPRGYVTVGGSSGGGTPPTNPPPTNPPPTNPPPTNPPPTNPPPTNPPPTNPPPTNPPGNSAPTVSIGGDESRDVETGENTTLTATGKDANSDTLTYQWSAAPSAGVTFSASKEAKTDVEFANEGDYTVTVTVSDGKGGQGKDTISFDVNNDEDGGDDGSTPGQNEDPVAEIDVASGSTSFVFADLLTPKSVTLSGSDSTDTEDDAANRSLSYQWTVTGPNGSNAKPTNVGGNPSLVTFTPDKIGSYKVTLRVIDSGGKDDSTPQTVTVTKPSLVITGPGNVSLNSTQDYTLSIGGGTVNQDVTTWSLNDVPNPGRLTSETTSNGITYNSPNVNTEVVLSVKINDQYVASGSSVTDTKTITVP